MIISHAEARRLEDRELRARMRHAGRLLKRIRRADMEPAPQWIIIMVVAVIAAAAVWGLAL